MERWPTHSPILDRVRWSTDCSSPVARGRLGGKSLVDETQHRKVVGCGWCLGARLAVDFRARGCGRPPWWPILGQPFRFEAATGQSCGQPPEFVVDRNDLGAALVVLADHVQLGLLQEAPCCKATGFVSRGLVQIARGLRWCNFVHAMWRLTKQTVLYLLAVLESLVICFVRNRVLVFLRQITLVCMYVCRATKPRFFHCSAPL